MFDGTGALVTLHARRLTDGPMPEGLPPGPGRILRASGRMPGSMWLSFEKLKDDGKVDANPLYRLGKDGFTLLDLTRKHYREAGLDVRELDALIR